VNIIVDPSIGTGVRTAALIEVRLTDVQPAARDTNIYELRRPDGGTLPSAGPGAHIDLYLPNGMVRQYSLTVCEPDPTRYLVGVKRDAASRGGSTYIHDHLKVGAQFKIHPPRNHFPLNENAEHTILIAGGIGITPIWCMVQRLAALGKSWQLYYSCRSRADTAFLAPLQKYEQVHFHFDEESDGIFLDLEGIVAAAPKNAHLYCCGPLPMLKAFEAAAAAANWPHPQIHVEYFIPKHEAAVAGGFTVELARSGQEFFIPEGKKILEVLLENGIDADYSCELGICGACETRVISGVPEHRDSILSDEEQASNTKVMICCAGSKSERLVLDL
jgi:tetrachlorobenzoquinone reductase